MFHVPSVMDLRCLHTVLPPLNEAISLLELCRLIYKKLYNCANPQNIVVTLYFGHLNSLLFKFLMLLKMSSLRKRRETNETDTLLEVFDNILLDTPSEIEDADDHFGDSRDHSPSSTDNEL